MAIRSVGTTTQVVVIGKLDAARTRRLAAALRDALRERPEILLVDLEEATLVDEACVRVLKSIDARARSQHAELVVLRPRLADADALQAFDGALADGDGEPEALR